MRDHRGIEQRRGFERILVSKIPAQQQLPFFGQSLAFEQKGADLFKPPAEEFVDVYLAATEFGADALQKGMDFFFGKSHNPGADLSGALTAADTKRPGQHMRSVRVQGDSAAGDVD